MNKMESRFEGKLSLITASTAGIGLAIAKRLLSEGSYVVISSRKEAHVKDALTELKEEGFSRVAGTVCDVKVETDRMYLLKFATRIFEKKTKLDILVSNAACSPFMGSTLDTPEEAWNRLFDINIKSAYFLIKESQEHLNDGGSILLVSSYLAFNPSGPIGIYGVTKTALLGLTKALASDFASRNIRVNCIAPGVVRTNFSRALWQDPNVNEAISNQCLLGRIAEVEEISGPAAFLCSNDASYITGETIVISGGSLSRL